MYSENDFRNYELYHHGILGQKWGRQQGPPYPLDASDHSSAERKAGWRQSLKDTLSGKKAAQRRADYDKREADKAKARADQLTKAANAKEKGIGKTVSQIRAGIARSNAKSLQEKANDSQIIADNKGRSFKERRAENKEAKKYNYKETERSDYQKKQDIIGSKDAHYAYNRYMYGKKNANKIEYLVDVKGMSRNAATKQVDSEVRKRNAAIMLGSQAAIGAAAVGAAKMATAIYANNIAVSAYSYQQGGLNEISGRAAGPIAVGRAAYVGSKVLDTYIKR